jgi:membrane protein
VDETTASPSDRQPPDSPRGLGARSWLAALGRTVRETKRDNLTDLAATLTYYAMLSIFPMLLAVLSVLGLIGDSATRPLLDHLREVSPGPARDIVTGAVENLERSGGSVGILFVVSVAGALWSASRYVAAFMRASNIVYEVDEGRPLWKKLPVRLGITVVVAVVLVVSAVAVVVTGDLAQQAGDLLGLGSGAVTAWSIAKWPVVFVVVGLLFALLYWASPNVRHPGFRWLVPGALTAVVLWLAAAVGFTLYVELFGSYNATYGTLGGVIVFLVWLWIANVAVLLGAELNAELERGRQIQAGAPPDEEPFLEHRDTAKLGHGP